MLVIESHARMRGQMLAAGRIQLNGWFQGELICSDLIVGPDGYLFGRATTRTLTLFGQIVGRAHVGNARLEAGAFFEGDLYHMTLNKSEEATLVGEAICSHGAFTLPVDLLNLEQSAHVEGAVDVNRPTSQTATATS